MGLVQDTSQGKVSASRRRLKPRDCLRKGCGGKYEPRQWRQRYCRVQECLREVRRWQAAKRQRRRRASVEVRQKHAEAERQRRQRHRAQRQESAGDHSSCNETQRRAWSRHKAIPAIFCDRPGCYDPPRPSSRAPARYCSDACRSALRRVRDRERKWLNRNTFAGRFKRQLEYRRARGERPEDILAAPAAASGVTCQNVVTDSRAVVDYRTATEANLSWAGSKEEDHHASETSVSSPPRSPPAS